MSPSPFPGATSTEAEATAKAAAQAELAKKFPMPSGDTSIPPRVYAIIWSLWALTTVFIALRLYCRSVRLKKLWWDDWLLIAAYLFLTLGVILQTVVFKLGYLVTVLGGPVLSPCNLASDNAMRLSVAMSKTSFAFTLLRLTGTIGWPRPVILASTFVVGALAVAHCVLVWKATCGVSNTWTFQPCWSSNGGLYMNLIGSVISAATDFIFTGIPIVVIWDLRLRRREKIGVGVAVALGSFAGIISIVKAQKSYEVISIVGPEFSQRLAVLSLMVHAEPNAAIIATTIPVLRVLFIDLIRNTRSKRSKSDNDPSSGLNPATVRSGPGLSSTRVTAKPIGRDNDSEKSILEDDVRNAGGIVTTRQIFVDYDINDRSDKSREAADGYEMGRMSSGPYSRVR